MTRIVYSREALLRFNTPANSVAPANLPLDFRNPTPRAIPTVRTLFNNPPTCKPLKNKSEFDNDLDPGAPGALCTV